MGNLLTGGGEQSRAEELPRSLPRSLLRSRGWLRMGLALGAPQNQGWKEQSRTPWPLLRASHHGITEG